MSTGYEDTPILNFNKGIKIENHLSFLSYGYDNDKYDIRNK